MSRQSMNKSRKEMAPSTVIYRSNEPHPADIPRLGSPFQFASNATVSASYNYRVTKSTPARRSQRHCARIDCPIPTIPHAFDRLPWISSMDIQPSQSQSVPSSDFADIADLSQLEVDPGHQQRSAPSHRVGPVRRRKTSFRSNPIASSESPSSLLLEYTKLSTSSSTPPPKHSKRSHSNALFHDLMPMLSCDTRHRADFSGPFMP